MRYIASTLPTGDRWKPIFDRYLGHLASRVDALGGKSSQVEANPDGTGRPYEPIDWRPGDPYPTQGFGSGGTGPGAKPCGPWSKCWEGWAAALVFALCFVFAGFLPVPWAAVALTVGVVVLAFLLYRWSCCCQGRLACAILDKLVLGSGGATFVLAILAIMSGVPPWSLLLLISSVVLIGAILATYLLRCRDDHC
jgi:hypothetical protein